MSTETIERPVSTEAPTVSYKLRGRGTDKEQWVVSGLEDLVVEGPVTVTLKNGKTKVVDVVGVGKAFLVDGKRHRYGYLTAQEEKPAAATADQSGAEFPPDNFVPASDEEDPDAWGF